MEQIRIEPQNFSCFFCALYCGHEIQAEYLIWNEEEQVAYPVCEAHIDEATRPQEEWVDDGFDFDIWLN